MMVAMLQLSAVTMKTVQWLQSAHNQMEYPNAKVMRVWSLNVTKGEGQYF